MSIALFDPAQHEPLDSDVWAESRARAFIEDVLRGADEAFEPHAGWPLHPEDRYAEDQSQDLGVYSGLAGTAWALATFAKQYGTPLRSDVLPSLRGAAERVNVPSFFTGSSGIYAAWYALSGDVAALEGIASAMERNAGNVTREIFWGSTGTAIPALILRERTGTARFDGLLREMIDDMWQTWPDANAEAPYLWAQDMYDKTQWYVGAGHGAFGNVMAFARAYDLLDTARAAQLHERVLQILNRYAIREGSALNWYSLGNPLYGNRLQWCHGAPGIIVSLASFGRGDERIEQYLVAAGEAIWQAGPIRKGPTLCHGTAGNGYAFLRLMERTGDERWLDRAKRFAMHAIAQALRWRDEFGMRSYSLFSGELGVAAYCDSVLRADPAFPMLETL